MQQLVIVRQQGRDADSGPEEPGRIIWARSGLRKRVGEYRTSLRGPREQVDGQSAGTNWHLSRCNRCVQDVTQYPGSSA